MHKYFLSGSFECDMKITVYDSWAVDSVPSVIFSYL